MCFKFFLNRISHFSLIFNQAQDRPFLPHTHTHTRLSVPTISLALRVTCTPLDTGCVDLLFSPHFFIHSVGLLTELCERYIYREIVSYFKLEKGIVLCRNASLTFNKVSHLFYTITSLYFLEIVFS